MAVGLALIPGGVGEVVIIPVSIVTAIGALFCSACGPMYSQMGATRTPCTVRCLASRQPRRRSSSPRWRRRSA
ncbi:MAG: hypothetical protein ACLT98_03385 [Eggerthellaceae bacterium]